MTKSHLSRFALGAKKNYYLENNVCYRGDIDFCEDYESVDICNECQDEFLLVISEDGKSYCHKVNEKLHCNQFKKKQSRSGVLECEKCEEEYIILESKSLFKQSFCMQIDLVRNCARYNIERAIPNSDFKCEECVEGFYFQNGRCEKRLLFIKECVEED